MNTDLPHGPRRAFAAACCLLLSACALPPTHPAAGDEAPLRALLAYYAAAPRPAAEVPRERAAAGDPYLLMQQAIHLGQSRPPDLARASNLLESVMKSTHPHAANLAPLARLLHEQYGERLRLEQQLRDAQRRAEQLQEKIDALTAIERSLPARPPAKPAGGGL